MAKAAKAENLPVKNEESKEVAAYEAEWGTEGVDAKDLLLPKLLLCQGLTKLVADEKAQLGDFANSVTGEVLGSARDKDKKPVRIVPFMTQKTWIEYEVIEDKDGGNQKREFRSIVPVTPENTAWPREETKDGVKISRDEAINFFVLLADKPDSLPYAITFKRTSYRAGQKLVTHIRDCARRKIPPASMMFNLTGIKRQNDYGTFYVYDVEPAGETPKEVLATAYSWYQDIKRRGETVKMDDSDIRGESEESVDPDMEGRF